MKMSFPRRIAVPEPCPPMSLAVGARVPSSIPPAPSNGREGLNHSSPKAFDTKGPSAHVAEAPQVSYLGRRHSSGGRTTRVTPNPNVNGHLAHR
jgi:hypothetical protein